MKPSFTNCRQKVMYNKYTNLRLSKKVCKKDFQQLFCPSPKG